MVVIEPQGPERQQVKRKAKPPWVWCTADFGYPAAGCPSDFGLLPILGLFGIDEGLLGLIQKTRTQGYQQRQLFPDQLVLQVAAIGGLIMAVSPIGGVTSTPGAPGLESYLKIL